MYNLQGLNILFSVVVSIFFLSNYVDSCTNLMRESSNLHVSSSVSLCA